MDRTVKNIGLKPLCMLENFRCVENVKVDDSNCLPSCTGLIVTSLSKTQQSKDWEYKESLQNFYWSSIHYLK